MSHLRGAEHGVEGLTLPTVLPVCCTGCASGMGSVGGAGRKVVTHFWSTTGLLQMLSIGRLTDQADTCQPVCQV